MDESQNKHTDLKKPKENPKVHTVESVTQNSRKCKLTCSYRKQISGWLGIEKGRRNYQRARENFGGWQNDNYLICGGFPGYFLNLSILQAN